MRFNILTKSVRDAMSAVGAKKTKVRATTIRPGSARTRRQPTPPPRPVPDFLARSSYWAMLFLVGHHSQQINPPSQVQTQLTLQ